MTDKPSPSGPKSQKRRPADALVSDKKDKNVELEPDDLKNVTGGGWDIKKNQKI